MEFFHSIRLYGLSNHLYNSASFVKPHRLIMDVEGPEGGSSESTDESSEEGSENVEGKQQERIKALEDRLEEIENEALTQLQAEQAEARADVESKMTRMRQILQQEIEDENGLTRREAKQMEIAIDDLEGKIGTIVDSAQEQEPVDPADSMLELADAIGAGLDELEGRETSKRYKAVDSAKAVARELLAARNVLEKSSPKEAEFKRYYEEAIRLRDEMVEKGTLKTLTRHYPEIAAGLQREIDNTAILFQQTDNIVPAEPAVPDATPEPITTAPAPTTAAPANPDTSVDEVDATADEITPVSDDVLTGQMEEAREAETRPRAKEALRNAQGVIRETQMARAALEQGDLDKAKQIQELARSVFDAIPQIVHKRHPEIVAQLNARIQETDAMIAGETTPDGTPETAPAAPEAPELRMMVPDDVLTEQIEEAREAETRPRAKEGLLTAQGVIRETQMARAALAEGDLDKAKQIQELAQSMFDAIPPIVHKRHGEIVVQLEDRLTQLDAMIAAEVSPIVPEAPTPAPEVVPATREVELSLTGKDIEDWIENIAPKWAAQINAEYGTNFTAQEIEQMILDQNADRIETVDQQKINDIPDFQPWHLNRQYVELSKGTSLNLRIQVPNPDATPSAVASQPASVTEAAAERDSDTSAIDVYREGQTMQADELEAALRTESQARGAELFDEYTQSLNGRTVAIPRFLRFRLNPNKWDELLRTATTDERPGAQRVIDLIQAEPFGWSPIEFKRNVIKRGANGQLSFRDLTKGKYDMTPQEFADDETISEPEKLNFVRACADLMDAVEAMQRGVDFQKQAIEEPTAYEHYMDYPSLTDYVGSPVKFSMIYSVEDLVNGGRAREVSGEEGTESIAASDEAVAQMKGALQTYISANPNSSLNQRKINKVDGGATLAILVNSYGMPYLIQNGHIQRDKDRLVLTSIPEEGNASVIQVLDSLKFKDGEATVDAEVAQAATQEVMAGSFERGGDVALEYAQGLLDQAFDVKMEGDEITLAESQAGRFKYYDSDFLNRAYAPGAIRERIVSRNRRFDAATGAVEYDPQGMVDDLQKAINDGIMGYALNPDMNILVEIEEALGSKKIEGNDRTQLEIAIGKIEAGTPELGKLRRQLENAERKEDTARIDSLKAEIAEVEQTLFDARTEYEGIIGRYLGDLQAALSLRTADGSLVTELSDQQVRFARAGARLGETTQMLSIEAARIDEIMEHFKDEPQVHAILEGLMESDLSRDYNSNDVYQAGLGIRTALNNGFTLEEIRPGSPLAGIVGYTETVQGPDGSREVEGAVLGALVDISLPKGRSLPIVATAGRDSLKGSGGGLGAGLSQEIGEGNIKLTPFFNVGAEGYTLSGLNLGAAAGATVTVEAGVFDLHAAGSVGWRLKGNLQEGLDATAGVGWSVGFQTNPERILEHARENAEHSAALSSRLEGVESAEQRAAIIGNMPQFKDIAQKMESGLSGGKTNSAYIQVLNNLYDDYVEDVGDNAEANTHIFPVGGIRLVGVGPVAIPVVVFPFRESTKAYALVETSGEMAAGSNVNISNELQKSLAQSELANVQLDILEINDSMDFPDPRLGYSVDGNLSIMPDSMGEIQTSYQGLIDRNLQRTNAQLLRHGMRLTPGAEGSPEEGLLRLDVIDRDSGNFRVIMDPSMHGVLIPGNNPGEIFIAADQLTGNMIFTRQEFQLSRLVNNRNESYREVIITIKSNPDASRNFNTFIEEGGGYVEFRGGSEALTVHAPEKGNVTRMDAFIAQRDDMAARGLLSTEMDQYLGETSEAVVMKRAVNMEGRSIEIDSAPMTDFARGFFLSNINLCLKATTEGQNMGANNTEMREQIQAAFQTEFGREMSDMEYDFAYTVIIRESFVKVPAGQREAFVQRHQNFFRATLTEQLGSQPLADRILSDIYPVDADRRATIAPSAELATVVGRNRVVGLRHKQAGENMALLSSVDYSNDAEMRPALVDMVRGQLPSEPAQFLRTSTALDVYVQFGLMMGAEAKNTLNEIYENPDLVTGNAPENARYREVYESFQQIVQQVRRAERSTNPDEQIVVVENKSTGQILRFAVESTILVGIREEDGARVCDNPETSIDSRLVPIIETGAARNVTAQASEIQVQTRTVEFLAGFRNRRSGETPPEGDGDTGVGENEEVEAGTGPGGGGGGNIDDGVTAPGTEDGDGAPQN